MSDLIRSAAKLREQAESLIKEAATLDAVAKVQAFADLAADFVHVNRREVWIRVPVASRDDAATEFAALTAIVSPLPVIAAKGAYSTVKPACDYEAKDGEIVLDADSALPCYLKIDGFGADRMGNKESLIAWFETPTDRVRVEFEINPSPASCFLQSVKDHRGRIIHQNWEWRGLPHSNMSFAYAGSPNSFAFLFDNSTDLAAWLAGRNTRDIRKS